MLRKLYDWTLRLAEHRRADWALAGISFAESSFFPIPPDVLLLPMVLANRARAWMLALNCTLSSVAGALFGYAIGYYFFALIGQPVIDFYHAGPAFDRFKTVYESWGAWVVLAAAISFLPFKVATIASGVTGLSLIPFVFASLVGRGTRFFMVAALAYFVGPTVRDWIDRYFNILSIAFIALLVLGFLAIQVL